MDMTKCAVSPIQNASKQVQLIARFRLLDPQVTVEWLIEFATSNDLLEKKTRDVVSDVVIPQTQANRSRYVELLSLQNESICGPVDVFVSHSWATKFGTLVSAVADNSRPGRRVWIDIFAVKQHRGDDQQSDLTQLKTVLREVQFCLSKMPVA